MNRSSIRVLLIVFITAAFLVSGCSGLSKSIQGLFASKTPTITVTPTPTVTPTITSTPRAPISITPCVYLEDCPDAIPLEQVLGYSASYDVVNNVSMPYEQKVQFYLGWIAIDDATLQQNLPHIKWFFTIDGQDYFQDSWLEDGFSTDPDDPSISSPGKWFGLAMSGWKVGETHFIRYGYVLDAPVNDGWDTYDAGTTLVFSWYIDPNDQPLATFTSTSTPEPTITSTPKVLPSKTSAPYVAPTATKGAEPKKDIQIKVKNNCKESHKVVLTGPITIKYNPAAGQTETHMAVHGTYTWVIDGIYTGGPQDLYTSIWTLTLCQ